MTDIEKKSILRKIDENKELWNKKIKKINELKISIEKLEKEAESDGSLKMISNILMNRNNVGINTLRSTIVNKPLLEDLINNEELINSRNKLLEESLKKSETLKNLSEDLKKGVVSTEKAKHLLEEIKSQAPNFKDYTPTGPSMF